MSSILKGLNESRSDWDSNMPGYQQREQDNMDYSKREFKRREMEHELGHEDEQERREQSQNWYIRINGKILKDKTKQPYTFRGKAAANKAALTMMNKDFNKGKKFTLTTSWMDAPAITEGTDGVTSSTYMQVKNLIDKMDKGGKKRIANALRKNLGQPVTEARKDDEADYGPEYQAMVKRVGQMAKEGPRKTVWDPVKRVYKTVPINQSKKEHDVAEGKWDPVTGGDFPTDYTGGEMENGPSVEKWKAMLEYYSNDIRVTRALDDLYRNAQSGSYYDSVVRADRYLATIENQRTGKTEKRYFPTKQEAYKYAKGYNAVVTSIEKIDRTEDTSDLITLPVMLGVGDHKKKWMLQFPNEAYAQKWEFKHKNVAKVLWDEGHALHTSEPESKPETKPEANKDDEEPGKYGYDTQTGEPLKQGQQSSRPQQGPRPQPSTRPQQYHTSQQVGYTKPSKYNKNDVTDVEVKEDDIDTVKRAVDNKGRTQQQWIQAVKSKFPDAKIIQSKMIDGPIQANLSDGRTLSWNKVEQGVAEEKQRLDPKCWTGYKKQGTKMKGGVRVNNCVPVKESAILKGLK
jgi:hypothetical protein